MHIVVLDGYTLNPGDLSWQALEALGAVRVHDRTDEEEIAARAADAEAVLVNKVPLSRATIERLPRLRYVGVLATGYDIVDVKAAAERGIVVTNIPTYGTRSVTQMTFAHLLNLTQRVAHHAETVREGRWTHSPDWCYWDYPLIELEGLVMGVIGFGRIGQNSARVAQAFGMRVLAHDAYVRESPVPDVRLVSLEELLRESDVITLHCPLTPETERMINAERLALVKPTAFLINTSRGAVIDDVALAEALNADRLAGAGLDVLPVEPPPEGSPLLTAKNCYITPHISWATRSARARLMQAAVDNLKAFLDGRRENVVN